MKRAACVSTGESTACLLEKFRRTEDSNTPKRQKTIASMIQEKDFEIKLSVMSDYTSSANRIYRVMYYTNAIGNLPIDICEKICNKWGRYSIDYKITRLVIYSEEKGIYSCEVWIDVFNS